MEFTKRAKIAGIIGLTIVVVLGAFFTLFEGEERPPSLDLIGGKQASVDVGNFIKYSKQEVAAYEVCSNSEQTSFNAGLNIFYFNKDTKIKTFLDENIIPTETLNVDMAIYRPGKEATYSEGFYGFNGIMKKVLPLKDTDIIPAKQAFLFYATEKGKFCNKDKLVASSNTFLTTETTSIPSLDSIKSGWVLVAMNPDVSEFISANKLDGRVKSIWTFKPTFGTATKLTDYSTKITTNDHSAIVWIKLKEKELPKYELTGLKVQAVKATTAYLIWDELKDADKVGFFKFTDNDQPLAQLTPSGASQLGANQPSTTHVLFDSTTESMQRTASVNNLSNGQHKICVIANYGEGIDVKACVDFEIEAPVEAVKYELTDLEVKSKEAPTVLLEWAELKNPNKITSFEFTDNNQSIKNHIGNGAPPDGVYATLTPLKRGAFISNLKTGNHVICVTAKYVDGVAKACTKSFGYTAASPSSEYAITDLEIVSKTSLSVNLKWTEPKDSNKIQQFTITDNGTPIYIFKSGDLPADKYAFIIGKNRASIVNLESADHTICVFAHYDEGSIAKSCTAKFAYTGAEKQVIYGARSNTDANSNPITPGSSEASLLSFSLGSTEANVKTIKIDGDVQSAAAFQLKNANTNEVYDSFSPAANSKNIIFNLDKGELKIESTKLLNLKVVGVDLASAALADTNITFSLAGDGVTFHESNITFEVFGSDITATHSFGKANITIVDTNKTDMQIISETTGLAEVMNFKITADKDVELTSLNIENVDVDGIGSWQDFTSLELLIDEATISPYALYGNKITLNLTSGTQKGFKLSKGRQYNIKILAHQSKKVTGNIPHKFSITAIVINGSTDTAANLSQTKIVGPLIFTIVGSKLPEQNIPLL